MIAKERMVHDGPRAGFDAARGQRVAVAEATEHELASAILGRYGQGDAEHAEAAVEWRRRFPRPWQRGEGKPWSWWAEDAITQRAAR